MSVLVFIQVMQGFKPWFLCFAAPLPFDSSSALLLLIRNSEMPFPHWLWQAPGVLSVKFSHVAEASGMYLLEAESGLLYFSAPAPPIDLSAEVAESLLSLSPSFKSWGWHTVRLMTSLPCSEPLFQMFRWLRQWLCHQLSSGYDLKIFLANTKVTLACLCISLILALSSPRTISVYQETMEKQIHTPLEAMLCSWGVLKKCVCILVLM